MTFDVARYQSLLPEIVCDLVAAELRARRPAKFAALDGDAVKASSDWKSDFSLDSMDRMALASACAECFNIYDSGREDTLLGKANAERWSEIIALAQSETTRNMTFRSSGSTGGAKHFRHRAEWLEEEALHWSKQVRLHARTRIVAHVPLHHIYGYLWVALLSAMSGLPFVRLPVERLRAPALVDGDVLITTPHLLESWVERGVQCAASDVIAVTSTGRFTRMSAGEARATLGLSSIWEIYGSSETAGLGLRKSDETHYAWLPYFTPTIDASNAVVSISRKLGNQTITIALPDRVIASDQKHFAVGARTDDIAKIAGHRIDLSELRELLRKAPGVADANVRATEDGGHGALKVFLVAATTDTSHEELVASVKTWLAAHWQHVGFVSQWRVGGAVPTNTIGKSIDW
jgi:long-chain acyl-CoA synthetase